MERTDMKELRKAIKAKDTVIDWIYSIYVDAENNLCWEDLTQLIDMEDAERFRHLTIFSKALSTRLGIDAHPVRIREQAADLLEMRSFSGKSTEAFAPFRDRLLESYTHTDPYYAALARIAYDVPTKASDGRALEDGDTVFEALLLAICPATLSKPVLGYDLDHVGELERRWQIGNPTCGFLYPSFDNRSEDRNEVLIRSAAPENEDFLGELFRVSGETAPVGVKQQRELFCEMLSRLDVDLGEAAAISETMVEKAAELESPVLDQMEMKKIAEAAGVDTEQFDEIYEDTVGATPIAITAVTDSSVTVKTDTVTIKLPAENAQLVETRRIDGRDYILIPADGTVTLNGTPVRACTVQEAAQEEGAEEDRSEEEP